MTESFDSLFDDALQRYEAGESASNLIPVFENLCDRFSRNSSAWSCLAWLYLLEDKPDKAIKAAKKSVKLDAKAPQARVNLALAMLDSGEKGVREHIEAAQQVMAMDADIRNGIFENLADGLKRKNDWKSLQKIQAWLA